MDLDLVLSAAGGAATVAQEGNAEDGFFFEPTLTVTGAPADQTGSGGPAGSA